MRLRCPQTKIGSHGLVTLLTDRTDIIARFLGGTLWADWSRAPLAGDASARRYERISNGHETAILMDADPKTGQKTRPFAEIGTWLNANGFSTPKTFLHDEAAGLMLIEDLGYTDFAKHLIHHATEAEALYAAATDVLIELDALAPPEGLTAMTPKIGGDMVAISPEWYGDPSQTQITDEMAEHLDRLCPIADTPALRDFHAENLIWRPDLAGLNRVGLLDYQDAFVAPRGYDLVSLLRDVRRRVDPTLVQKMTVQFATATQINLDTFDAAFACLAAQRNLRILGVFARLALKDDKPKYVTMIPHIWSMIAKDVQHPKLKKLQKCLYQTLPSPENSKIGSLL